MTESIARIGSKVTDDEEVSLLVVGIILLRRRRIILGVGVACAALALAFGLIQHRVYKVTTTFLPEANESAKLGLAALASQFGARLPTSGSSAWGPPIYVELLTSQMMLEPIAFDTLAVPEQGGRRIAIMDLLKVHAKTPDLRTMLTVKALRKMIVASEDRRLGLVRLTVKTRWPSVSLAFADQLVSSVNRFNLETRKSQALAERQFVDRQAAEAEIALRESEDRLKLFLVRNRAIGGSPELAFERDRLQREVALRQQIYTSLLESREEARIRAVRDVPVITVLENPRLPLKREPRGILRKTFLGGLVGTLLGVLGALALHWVAAARRSSNRETAEFLQLVDDAMPRLFRPGRT